MNAELYDELVGAIYDAAVDTELWPLFLERVSDLFGSRGTVIYLVDYADRSVLCQSPVFSFLRHVRLDPDYIHSYDRHYSKVNVWFDRSKDLPEGVPTTGDLLYPEDELPKTEWYGDWLRPQGYFHVLTGHLLKQDNLAVRLSVFRQERQAGFGPDELAGYARLMPHLRRACKIHRRFAEIQAVQGAGDEALNRLPMGVVLLDGQGRVVFLNRAAESIARCADGFRVGLSGCCSASGEAQTRALRSLIAQACPGPACGKPRRGGAMALARQGSPRPLVAVAAPLPGEALPFISPAPGAVLFLCDPDRQAKPDDGLLSRLYGLTRAEARLASALAGGCSVNDYAEAQGVSLNTVRTQLKQILAKTGVRRQPELVRLLLANPVWPESGDGSSES